MPRTPAMANTKPEDYYQFQQQGGQYQQQPPTIASSSSATSTPRAAPSPSALSVPAAPEQSQQQPQPKQKRLRTESQLNQKRLADRIRHRENRLEGKHRLAKMESDIADIKASLHNMSLHLQALAVRPPPSAGAHPMLGVVSPRQGITQDAGVAFGAGHAHAGVVGSPTTPAPQQQPHFLQFAASAEDQGFMRTYPPAWPPNSAAANPATRLWRQPPSVPQTAKLINCRCGSQHLDRFDSMDMCSVTALYQHHIAFSPMQAVTSALPRNPSLPAMMLHSLEDNLATYLITGFLRQYKNKSLEQLLGFYLLGYRYMRWRMNPCEETVRDVPAWLMPTELQKSRPHPVVVDYLPWPRLRDYLCTSGNEDPRHCINLYFESMELNWPLDTPLFHQGGDGQVSLSPEFELAVSTLDHWRLGSPWSEEFPHLMYLTTP